MGTLSATFENLAGPTFAASGVMSLRKGDSLTYNVSGTLDAGCSLHLQKSTIPGVWLDVDSWSAEVVSESSVALATEVDCQLRFLCRVTAENSLTGPVAVSLVDAVDAGQTFYDRNGNPVAGTDDNGLVADVISERTPAAGVTVDGVKLKDGGAEFTAAVKADTISEKTSNAGVTIDSVLLKDGGVVPTGSIQLARVSASGAISVGRGASASEGVQELVLDQTISFAANAALYKELNVVLPAGSVVLFAQANIQAALTGGGTTTKVGLGTEADPDLWGKTSALTKDAKIDTIVTTLAAVAAPTVIRLSSCANDGSAGDTALTVGSVRVRMVYLVPLSLANA